ncbi:MAG: right-handed parallel beta-helix repeat-containing protein [Steroidobacteraceae bacterium]|jgi:hypothetical protein|nr:right-handed parallel beta-helix repeat-containing protein [Steroidobacteraceae bacterium]
MIHRSLCRRRLASRGALFALLLCVAAPSAQAAPWSGVVDPARATDWSGAGVAGGIPSRTTVCTTLSPGATAAQINSALAGCPAGQVVSLAAGTYNLSGMLTVARSNVTLRGAGADRTKLVFTARGNCGGTPAAVCVNGPWIQGWNNGTPQNLANWTAGYAQGSRTITLSTTANLQPGSRIILEQSDDAADSAGVYVCAMAGVCGYTAPNGDYRGNRRQRQIVTVASVSGSQVTLNEPLHMPNWRASQVPAARWTSGGLQGVGIEDLSVQVPGPPVHNGGSNFVLFGATNSWLEGVRSVHAERNHVTIYQSARITVRDSYFYGSNFAHYTSYGIEIYAASSSNLVENNVFQHVTNPVIINDGGSGMVVGYNFAIDNYRVNPSNLMVAFFQVHAPGAGMNLIEGNSGTAVAADNWYGTTHFMTFFRNHLYGDVCSAYLSGCPTKDSQTWVMQIAAFSRFFNFVGNVLGRTGYYTTYQPTSYTQCDPRTIWCLGYSHANGGPTDAQTKPRAMRWGNFDTVTGQVRWDATEVPSGLAQFANAVPASRQLPPSFYLAARPAWFGNAPYPAVGPDVTGGTVTGYAGLVHRIPARACWESLATDPAFGSAYEGGQVRVFNADACYYGTRTSRPNPPTNVQAR